MPILIDFMISVIHWLYLEIHEHQWCLVKKDKQKPTESEKIILEELSIVNEAIIFARNDLQNNPSTRVT